MISSFFMKIQKLREAKLSFASGYYAMEPGFSVAQSRCACLQSTLSSLRYFLSPCSSFPSSLLTSPYHECLCVWESEKKGREERREGEKGREIFN